MIMNEDAAWAVIDRQRARTVAMLVELSADDWSRPSLCAGWTVRDVTAHLTLQQLGLRDALGQLIRHPAPMNRAIQDWARRKAVLPPSS